MSAEDKTFVVKISTVLDRGGTALFQGTEAASERMRAKVQADAAAAGRAVGEAGREGGEAFARNMNAAAKRGQAAIAESLRALEAAGEASAARDVARAERSAQAKVRADLRAFDARIKGAERAAAAEQRLRERTAAAETRSAERAAMAKERSAERAARAEEKTFERTRRNYERLRDEENRQIVQEAAAAERTSARKAAAEERANKTKARDLMSGSWSNMRAVGRAAEGVGKDVLGGLGVHFDLGSAIRNRAQLGDQIQDVINQAKIAGQDPGAGAHGRLTGVVDKVADTGGLDASRVAMVLSEMQAKSSDLEGAVKALPELGKLASAAKADMGDLGKAAGMVNAQLVNMEEFKGPANAEKRAHALMDIMRHITKQTADGSVEMSDMARYIGRVASAAQNFAGGFEKNIGTLGALSQLAMRGGATTASEATNSAANLARDLMKNKNIKNWDAAGINLFADKDRTQIRGMDEIIVDYLRKFGADKKQLAKMFPSSSSSRAVRGAINVFNDAGGGEQGIAAVKAEMAKFSATISKDQVDELAKDKENSPLAKAQRFQNQLERIADSMTATVLPALEQLAPEALAVAKAFASLVGFAAQNPGLAITGAIVGSIVKAQLGQVITTTIQSGLGKLLGAGGMAIPMASIAIAAATIVASKLQSDTDKGMADAKKTIDQTEEVLKKAEKEYHETGKLSDDTLRQLKNEQITVDKEQAELSGPQLSKFDIAKAYLTPGESGSKTTEQWGEQGVLQQKSGVISHEKAGIDALIKAVEGQGKAIADLKTGMKVEVTNMPQGSMIPADGRPPQ
jgi:hypothetical protein